MHAAHRVADHLVFVDHEKLRPVATQEAGALRFERGDDDLGIEVQGEIAGRDADIPAAGAPFGELVVRECAGRDGEDGLAFERGIEQLENVSLARAGGRLDNHVLARLQSAHRFLLPEIGDDQVDLEPLQHCAASHGKGVAFKCRARLSSFSIRWDEEAAKFPGAFCWARDKLGTHFDFTPCENSSASAPPLLRHPRPRLGRPLRLPGRARGLP